MSPRPSPARVVPAPVSEEPIAAHALLVRFEQEVVAELEDNGATVRIGASSFRSAELLRKYDADAYQEHFEEWRNDIWEPEQRRIVTDICALSGNRKRFEDLTRCMSRSQVVPFVGSGMSVPSGFKMWTAFLQEMRTRSKLDEASFKRILATSYEDAAEAIRNNMPSSLFDEQFEAEFSLESYRKPEGAVQWLPTLCPNLAITTNYDPILEDLYTTAGSPFEISLAGDEISDFRKFRTAGDRCLLKIHGDRLKPATRVLTRGEYDRAYAPGSLAREELEFVFRGHTLLFLGCSLAQDRTMEVLGELSAKAGGRMPRHYAFLPDPMDDAMRLDREHFLVARSIFPIWYRNSHDEALEALLSVLALDSAKV